MVVVVVVVAVVLGCDCGESIDLSIYLSRKCGIITQLLIIDNLKINYFFSFCVSVTSISVR